MRLIFKSSLLLCTTLCIFGEQTIPVADAAKHVGAKATVCSVVASARYVSRSKG